MVEIEHIQDIEKDQPAKSSAKEQKLKDPKDFRNKKSISGQAWFDSTTSSKLKQIAYVQQKASKTPR